MIALAVGLALSVDPSVKPWPIGRGPQYHPAAATSAVRNGQPIDELRCGSNGKTFRVHIELFADRHAVVIPAGIGVAQPYRTTLGTIAPQGCSYPVRTLTPTGVVEVASGTRLTVGDFFRVWGEPLTARRLGPFSSGAPVRAYVAGQLVRGSASAIGLRTGEQIVLELGGFVAPHASFLFPKGS